MMFFLLLHKMFRVFLNEISIYFINNVTKKACNGS